MGWLRVCVARDGLNIELLHIGHVLLMLSSSGTCQDLLADLLCMSYVHHTTLNVSLCHQQRANRNCLTWMVYH